MIILTKLDTAAPEKVRAVRDTISQYNPRATVIESALPLTVDQPGRMAGARVLAVEDGPTLPTAA